MHHISNTHVLYRIYTWHRDNPHRDIVAATARESSHLEYIGLRRFASVVLAAVVFQIVLCEDVPIYNLYYYICCICSFCGELYKSTECAKRCRLFAYINEKQKRNVKFSPQFVMNFVFLLRILCIDGSHIIWPKPYCRVSMSTIILAVIRMRWGALVPILILMIFIINALYREYLIKHF